MSTATDIGIRLAESTDATPIAKLHAESWRRHYRGAYSDTYLDGDLDTDRLVVWTEQLSHPAPGDFTLVAENRARLIGFAHVVLNADSTWGALVENLHVDRSSQRNGVGGRLLEATARMVLEREPGSGVYLWVLEQNERAQAFYAARSGTFCDRVLAAPPGGEPRNLDGTPIKIRVAWPDPLAMMSRTDPAP